MDKGIWPRSKGPSWRILLGSFVLGAFLAATALFFLSGRPPAVGRGAVLARVHTALEHPSFTAEEVGIIKVALLSKSTEDIHFLLDGSPRQTMANLKMLAAASDSAGFEGRLQDKDAGEGQGARVSAAATNADREKPTVRLQPVGRETIQTRVHEKNAARRAYRKEAIMQEAREIQNVQDTAEQQRAKGMAAYNAEIEAVADGSPIGSKPVNASEYGLTKEMVAAVAKDGVVIVTWCNFHFFDFAKNWLMHIRDLNLNSYVIGAMDDEVLQELVNLGANTFAMQSGLPTGDLAWGGASFHKMGRRKIKWIEAITTWGFDVLISDIDVVWLKNPMPYFAKYPEADILVSSDAVEVTTSDHSLEVGPALHTGFNDGIMLLRKSTAAFNKEWDDVMVKDEKIWDQAAFNDMLRRGMQTVTRDDHLFQVWDGKLWMGILPCATFASGHTYFVQHLAARHKLEPYVVHATFQYSGTPGKRHRMREALLWDVDPPEYYDPPGGLITFTPQISHLLDGAAPATNKGRLEDFVGHFALVNAQITQVRNAVALAVALNRTLVMPQLWCGADRWWAPHSGNIPPATMPLPYACPMDHVFDLEMWLKELPEDEYGRGVRFRESSFFVNPLLPQEVASSRANLTICAAGDVGCSDDLQPPSAKSQTIRLKHGLKDKEVVTALEAFKDVKVLHFSNLSAGFGGFAEEADALKFQKRTTLFTSIWCCVQAPVGHVWYDFFWDQIPHQDRQGRKIEKRWEPAVGP